MTAESFRERVLSQQAAAKEEARHEVCQVCKKHFSSENAYTSHLRSRKHKENTARLDAKTSTGDGNEGDKLVTEKNKENIKDSTETVDSDKQEDDNASTESEYEPEPLEITECLFCPHESKDLEASLSHMSMKHGFFIPDLHYLTDVKGLIRYLCEKVGVGYMCLWCNTKGKAFHSVESAQQHMVDKCHCRLFFEADAALEYAEYYDYSSSYPDQEANQASGDTVAPDTSLTISEDLELVLPSGTKVGHRSLRHTYKQHLPTFEQRKAALISRLMAQYRALGWKEGGVSEGTGARLRSEKWALKMKQARDTKLRVKANKMQPHLRPQVIF